MKLILMPIMFLVKKLKNQNSHYLSVSDELISWIRIDRIMKFGHILPSLVITILIAVKLLPLVSVQYAEHLAKNDAVILLTAIFLLIPILIINGLIIEVVLEKTNSDYQNFKSRS